MYTFDASSIYALMWRGRLTPLSDGLTVELARYELGNAFWKEAVLKGRLSVEEALSLIKLASEVLRRMEVLSLNGDEGEVFKLAYSEGLTFYDSSYLYAAIKTGTPLVTEDERLRRTAVRHVGVLKVEDLLKLV